MLPCRTPPRSTQADGSEPSSQSTPKPFCHGLRCSRCSTVFSSSIHSCMRLPRPSAWSYGDSRSLAISASDWLVRWRNSSARVRQLGSCDSKRDSMWFQSALVFIGPCPARVPAPLAATGSALNSLEGGERLVGHRPVPPVIRTDSAQAHSIGGRSRHATTRSSRPSRDSATGSPVAERETRADRQVVPYLTDFKGNSCLSALIDPCWTNGSKRSQINRLNAVCRRQEARAPGKGARCFVGERRSLAGRTMTRDVDLLITGGTVITMDEERRPLPSGWVAISGNRIVAVGPGDPPVSTGRPKRRIDATGTVVMPGLVSCHGHACNSLVRGMAEDRPLHEWLTEVLWPAMSHAGPDEVYRGALLSAVEMLRSGVTCFADMWTEVPSTARAVEQVGLRALLAYNLRDFGDPGKPPSRLSARSGRGASATGWEMEGSASDSGLIPSTPALPRCCAARASLRASTGSCSRPTSRRPAGSSSRASSVTASLRLPTWTEWDSSVRT